MFTDIAAAIPGVRFETFDYNKADGVGNMTVQPLPEQVATLNAKLADAGGEVTLLCHSQGCVIAAMADLDRVTDVIFLAPPENLSVARLARIFGTRPGAVFDPAGMSSLPRRDGTTTYVGKEYMESIAGVDVRQLFAALATKRPTAIVRAADDEVVGVTEFPGVAARIITLPGGHDFADGARSALITELKTLLNIT
jgi:hypothetical protein